MLVLSRRIGERITIGDSAEMDVTILGIRGSQVSIGINAPREVSVHRQEIYHKIQAEQKEFSNGRP